MVEVRQNLLKANDLLARDLGEHFHRAGLHVIGLVSSPGLGKTTLLERQLTDLDRQY